MRVVVIDIVIDVYRQLATYDSPLRMPVLRLMNSPLRTPVDVSCSTLDIGGLKGLMKSTVEL